MASSNAPHLSTGPIDLGLVRDNARKELLNLLDRRPGTKALVWDFPLTDRFGLIADFTLLQKHEVGRMFPLDGGTLPKSEVQHIIFITRPKTDLMELIAQSIQREEDVSPSRKEFHIFFVPWKRYQCIQKLEVLGVSISSIEEYRLDLIPLDYDVLSMELPNSVVDCVIHEDYTSLYLVARALNGLQQIFGTIPQICGVGEFAPIWKRLIRQLLPQTKYNKMTLDLGGMKFVTEERVGDIIQRIRSETRSSEESIPQQIDRLLIIDRTVDPISPLVTQLTYEGLIDEVYGINNSTGKFPREKFSSDKKQEEDLNNPMKIMLSSKDELFGTLRDKNFNAVGPILKSTAKQVTEQFDERHAAKTVGEIKKFVSHIPQMQQAKKDLANHTSIAELIKEFTDTETFLDTIAIEQEFLNGMGTDKISPYLEDCLFRKDPLHKVLRLLCLQCLTNNGFKPKVLEYYKREIIHTYGYEHIITIHNLEKAGLLRPRSRNWNYNTIRKSLRLVVEDVNEKDPRDMAYVHSGYAPLSGRLVQIYSHPGWRSIEEVIRLLPGSQMQPMKQSPSRRKWKVAGSGKDTTVTMVFFIGGVTFAEISALRFLGDLESGGPKEEYVIATTSIINGNTMIKGFIESCNVKSN